MKVILNEEQIKLFFKKATLREADGDGSAIDLLRNSLDMVKNSSAKINSILSTNNTPDSEPEDTKDPMPNGPMAYADEKREEYNNSIGVNSTWLSIVQKTYADFKGPLFHSKYNQSGFKKYNGSTARSDCTGFICAALRNAGYKVPNNNSRGMVSGGSFTNQISGGFTRVNWNKNAYGTINGKPLPAGTILCRPGHGMIVGEYNPSTKKLKGYDYGHNNHDENNPVNMEKIYTVAWIPKGGENI